MCVDVSRVRLVHGSLSYSMPDTEAQMRVRVFLRSPLFTFAGHVPRNASVVEGLVTEAQELGYTVAVESFADDRGRPLEGAAVKLVLPREKIDHVLVLG